MIRHVAGIVDLNTFPKKCMGISLNVVLAVGMGLLPTEVVWADAVAENAAAGLQTVVPEKALPPVKFNGKRDEIGEFIRLKIGDDGGLALDRSIWDLLDYKQTDEQRFQQLKQKFENLSPSAGEDFITRRALDEFNAEKSKDSPVFRAFKRLETKTNSVSHARSDRSWQFFIPELKCELIFEELDAAHIVLSEAVDDVIPKRVSLLDDAKGELHLFVFLGEAEPLLTLEQAGGKISVVYLTDTAVSSRSAVNFLSLAKKDDIFVREKLFRILNHMGIRPPPEYDQEILKAALMLLTGREETGSVDEQVVKAKGLLNDMEILSSWLARVSDEKEKELIESRLAQIRSPNNVPANIFPAVPEE